MLRLAILTFTGSAAVLCYFDNSLRFNNMAISVEVKRRTFKLEINLGEEVDEGEANVVKDIALSFMESRACQEDDVPDGVDVADKLHTAALAEHEDHTNGNGVGWKVGKMYAQWGDNLFIDHKSKQQLMKLLESFLTSAVESGGSLFFQALKAILCDKYGVGMSLHACTPPYYLCFAELDIYKLGLSLYVHASAERICDQPVYAQHIHTQCVLYSLNCGIISETTC